MILILCTKFFENMKDHVSYLYVSMSLRMKGSCIMKNIHQFLFVMDIQLLYYEVGSK